MNEEMKNEENEKRKKKQKIKFRVFNKEMNKTLLNIG